MLYNLMNMITALKTTTSTFFEAEESEIVHIDVIFIYLNAF